MPMGDNLPALVDPLTHPRCDLRSFKFMPLEVATLRDAGIMAAISPEGFRAAVLLWCAAWHQLPAASLPDDDRELARLAGYGFVVKAWQEVREEALYGFVKCRDGRLYHPIIAKHANEAFDRIEDRLDDRERDRQRLRDWRASKRSKKTTSPETENETPRNAFETSKTGTETGTGKRQIEIEDVLSNESTRPQPEIEQATAAWNEMADRTGLKQIRSMNDTRRKHLKARLADHGLDGWAEMLRKVEPSSFLNGRSARGWVVSFDFVINSTNFLKIIEGKYDDRAPAHPGDTRGSRESEKFGNMLEGAMALAKRRG